MKYKNNRTTIDSWQLDRTNSQKGKEQGECILFSISDYHILKRTNSFRFVSEGDVYTHRYAGYIFFNKKVYDKNHIEKWLKFIKENKLDLKYLNKPFPPFDPYDKIIVRNVM